MSMAGGYYRSVELARDAGCDCVQLFTKNNNQWRAKPITDDEAKAFRRALRRLKIKKPLSHTSYLLNLASPDKELRKKSIDGLVVELARAEQLGIPYVVMHPGSYTTGTEKGGLRKIIQGLDAIHRQLADCKTKVLLETTAGQGTNLGWKFEHLAAILDGVKAPERLGVCVDTCHIFAAGYRLETAAEYAATMRELNSTVGIKMVKAVHLNDSKRELGSRVDRHHHIGRGEMGLEPFRNLLNDRRFRHVPMYLETAKGEEKGENLDVINLRVLRELVEEGE
jgi:deoxyribonuclease-4